MARACSRPTETVPAPMSNPAERAPYAQSLTAHLWAYRREAFGDEPDLFDVQYSRLPNPPVFTQASAHRNVIVAEDPDLAAAVLNLLPREKQHRWFRSMKSSQALALSVFGNLKILNRTDCLAEVLDEDGAGPAFRHGIIRSDDLEVEYDVTSLNEIRATSVDLLVSGPTIICVESSYLRRKSGAAPDQLSRESTPSTAADRTLNRKTGPTDVCLLNVE
jgi:hypothetical protein